MQSGANGLGPNTGAPHPVQAHRGRFEDRIARSRQRRRSRSGAHRCDPVAHRKRLRHSLDHGNRKLLDGALVNPVPIAPTLDDKTDLTVAVDVSGPAEAQSPPPPTAPVLDGNAYRQRIRSFVESLRPARPATAPTRGIVDI